MNRRNRNYRFFEVVVILIVLSEFISLASAYEESELQWAPGVSNTFHLNDVISYNGYTVKATGFPKPVESNRYSEIPNEPVNPFVGLNVSKNGSFANNTALGTGESYITPDGEMRVMVTGLPSGNSTEWLFESYKPWAIVELNPRGKPELEVTIDTDKGEYSSAEDTEINAFVTITNSGAGDVVNVDMNIDTPFSVKNGSLKYHYQRIKEGESVTEYITFNSPVPTEDKTYSIIANVSGYDVKNLAYPANSSKQISVTIDPKWSMSLRKTTLEKIYLKDSAMISLDLKNNGKIDINNVSIDDSLPSNFKLIGNTSLHWVVDIPAGGEWNYRYIVAPLEPNAEGIIFPVATAEFKVNSELYGIRSNQPKMVVYGPLVILNKSTDVSAINPGGTATVTVTAKNTGSTPTKVFIEDQLPANTTLISGIIEYEDFLEAGKEINFSYTLKVYSDIPIELPPANAQYYELGTAGRKINTSSQKLELMIKSSIEANVTPVKIQPSNESRNNYTNSSTINGLDKGTYESGTNVSGTKGYGIFNFISKIIQDIVRIIRAGFGSINITSSSISFTDPTLANSATLAQNYAYINTTVYDASTAFIDWNHSLVGWWRFNQENGENSSFFRDWSSWGNNGTCSGTTCPVSISGKFGNALGFDGLDDYVTVPNSESLNPSNITVEAWFNVVSGSLAYQKSLVQKPYISHTNPYYQYMLSLMDTATNPKQAAFLVTINGVLQYVETSNLNYGYGQWHHLVGTYNGSNIALYLDGTLVATKAVSGTLNSYNTVLQFGAYPNLDKIPAYVFGGKIDEVRIHNRALSPEEIKASYNAGVYRLYNNFTNLVNGVYNYKAYSQDLSGTVNQTETKTLTLTS